MTTGASAFEDDLRSQCRAALAQLGLEQHEPLLAGGRLLRSKLALVAHGESSHLLVELCTALELLHTSTLVHDDIIDQAETRRGHRTVSRVEGQSVAILAGDLLLGHALQIISQQAPRLIGDVLATYQDVSRSQLLEVRQRAKVEKSLRVYLEVCRGKTAAMLQLALKMGLWPDTVPASDPLFLALENIGLAFQLTDDIEDVERWLTHDARSPSKSSMADVELQNYTAPALFAIDPDHGQADARSIDLKQITPLEWRRGVDKAADLRDTHLRSALEQLEEAVAGEGPAHERNLRLAGWLKRLCDSLPTAPLDETVRIG